MRTFFIMTLVTFLATHAYIYWNLHRTFGNGRVWQGIFFLLCLVMFAAFLFRRNLPESPMGMALVFISYYWVGFVMLSISWLVMADVLRLLALAVGKFGGGNALGFLLGKKFALLVFAWCLGLFGWALYEAQNVQIKEVTLKTDKLPQAVQTLTIAAMSDVHLSPQTSLKKLDSIVEMCNAQQPDVIVMLGDLVDTNMHSRNGEKDILRKLQAPLGKFAILGNHEYYRGLENSIKFTEDAGFTLLRGRVEQVGGIEIAGIDDPIVPNRALAPDVLAKADQNKFVLFLSHRPAIPEKAAGLFDLQLSGHTHGGQIWPAGLLTWLVHGCKQGLGPVAPNPDLPNGKKGLLYLSNGTGYWGPPLRLFSPPEITVVKLVRK